MTDINPNGFQMTKMFRIYESKPIIFSDFLSLSICCRMQTATQKMHITVSACDVDYSLVISHKLNFILSHFKWPEHKKCLLLIVFFAPRRNIK